MCWVHRRGGPRKDAGLRAGGPVHRAIGIREKPDRSPSSVHAGAEPGPADAGPSALLRQPAAAYRFLVESWYGRDGSCTRRFLLRWTTRRFPRGPLVAARELA